LEIENKKQLALPFQAACPFAELGFGEIILLLAPDNL